jgi:predicted transcriptional regulator
LFDLNNIAEILNGPIQANFNDESNRGRKEMKRSKHTIISEILSICKGGASKTRIVYQANLNFRTVNPYINLLVKNNLIVIKQDKGKIYETTELGMNLLDEFKYISSQLIENESVTA